MGVRLVGEALNPAWAGLSDRARLILLQMAYVARDKAAEGRAAGVYFGGHRSLIVNVLGEDPDRLDQAALDLAEQKIKRAVQELKKAGAITLIVSPSRGRNAVYEVHPDRFPGLTPVDNQNPPGKKGGHPMTPTGGHPMTPNLAEWGSPHDEKGGHPMTPLIPEEQENKNDDQQSHHPTEPTDQLRPERTRDLWKTR